jgi:hypothetical protein
MIRLSVVSGAKIEEHFLKGTIQQYCLADNGHFMLIVIKREKKFWQLFRPYT